MARYEHSAAAAVAKQPVGGVKSSVAPSCECPVLTESPATATPPTGAGRHDDELRDAFQVFDKDKDGFLSATDLRSVRSAVTHSHCISDHRRNHAVYCELVHGQVTIIFLVSVCLSVCLFVCAEFFSAIFYPISIKLGHMLYV